MKKLLEILKSRLFWVVMGLLALSALVWWVGPLVAIADARPLGPWWARLIVLALIWLGLAARLAYVAWKRKRTNDALMQGMAAGPSAADKEVAILQARFKEATEVLQKAPGGKKAGLLSGGQMLYELPWYIFIGAPGSGKTTALLNAGLTFPLADKLGHGGVKGVGGTRNCDWWFTDEAVLIDTAGRYTTQESDAQTDAAAWEGFLSLLRKTRPRRPINGVMLTVNVQDLLQQSPQERVEHAAKLRARIQELHTKLGVRPPVYVLVTKADLIAGFNECFEPLGQEEREQVWGFSFEHEPGQPVGEPLKAFAREYERLEQRLRERILDRMEAEHDVLKRAAIFAFPQQFASIKTVLGAFLDQVFTSGGQLDEAALLRGVYFTSGTQEGTPIDRVLGTLARTFGVDRRVSATIAGRGRSYFLSRLLKEVVFAEQGLVGINLREERRRRTLRIAAMASIAVFSVALIAGWALSFARNKSYIADVDARLPELKKAVASIPAANNGDVTSLPQVLTQVRAAAVPATFALPDPPLLNALGLYQGPKLDASAQIAYDRLLDHAFMPRVANRLEERLRAVNRDNLELAYEALKGYLMLYTPDQFDAQALKLWITLDWDVNLQGSLSPEQRQALNTHLDAMLARGAPRPIVPMDKTLVASVRDMLAAYPLEYRIYSRLKRQQLASGIPEFSVSSAAGPQASQVFERASGEALTKGIPGLYTRDGFRKALDPAVQKATLQLAAEESWVMGIGGGAATAARLKDAALGRELTDRVRRLYFEDYIKTWDAYLADVRLIRLGGLERSLQTARILAGVDSPLASYLRGVARETTLVQAPTATDTVAGKLDAKADAARKELAALAGGGAPAPNTAGAPAGPLEKMVDDHFLAIRRLVEGQPAPIDDIMKMFNQVYVQLSAVDAAQKSKTAPPPGGGGGDVKAAAGLQPEPIRSMLESLADAGASQSRVAERASLTTELKPITDFCARAVAGRYPFSPGSKADVMPEDFGQLFGSGGMLDEFFQRKLFALVDTGTNPWSFKPLADGSKPVAAAALSDFQRAARIREVFFRGGGRTPSFRLDIRAVELADGLKEVTLDVDGQAFKLTGPTSAPASLSWPSARVSSQVRLMGSGSATPLQFDGPWALFRMFDRFDVQPVPQQPEKFIVTLNLDGRRARLEVTANSVFNPFRLREIQQFRCPGAL